jgi:uncharacterized protein with PIN domain
MIDEKATKKEFGYISSELSPGSNKPIIFICNSCEKRVKTRRNTYNEKRQCLSCTRKIVKVSKDSIIKDIARVAKQLEHQPTAKEYVKVGKYALETLKRAFGKGWKETLIELGYNIVRRKNDQYSFEEIKADLVAVKQKLGHVPGMKEYLENGKTNYAVIKRATRSKSWAEAMKKVFNITEEEAKKFAQGARPKDIEPKLEELRQLAKKLKRTPSSSDARRNGINTKTLRNHLGSKWTEIVIAAGLDPNKLTQLSLSHLTTDKEILKDVKRVIRELGKSPRLSDYEEKGKFGRKILKSRFGSWQTVLEAAGLEIENRYKEHKAGIYKPTEYYLEKLRELAKKLGHVPTSTEAAKEGIRCWQLNERLNTNWAGVIEAAGLKAEGLSKYALYVKEQEVIEDIRQVVGILGKIPSRVEYIKHGKFDINLVFGGFCISPEKD